MPSKRSPRHALPPRSGTLFFPGVLFGLLAFVACLTLPAPAFASKDSAPDWVHAAAAAPVTGVPEDAKAVVLLDETVFTVGADGKAVEHRRRVIKILRPNGRDAGLVYVPFDADTKVLSLHVWSIAPGGQEFSVKDKDVMEVGEPNSGPEYSDLKEKVVDAPGRDPGGIIAYEYDQRQAPYSHEADWFVQDELPRLHQSFTLELPPGYTYASVWAHHADLPGRDLEKGRIGWDLPSTPRIDLDHVAFAPPMDGLVGRMTVHYGPAASDLPPLGTWQEVGTLYDAMARDRMTANPAITAKSTELTAGKTDFYDRTEAIGEFVQKDIRYFVIEKGVGGWQPHPASEIFQNRYGDCKDKSTLLAAMLGSVGIHSVIVLVDTHRGFIDPAAPSMMGNHAIAAVEIPAGYQSPRLRSVVTAKSGKRYLIVDPTWDKTAFGQLEHNLQGGYGVLVEGRNSEVIQFPVLSPALNTMERTATLDLAADGSLKGTVLETRFGDDSERLRALYSEGDVKQQQASLDRRMGQDFTAFQVSDVKVDNVNTLNKPVTMSYHLSADGYSRSMGPLLLVRPRVMGSSGIGLDRKQRKYPIDLEETETHKDDFTIHIPDGYTVDELPDDVKLDVGFATYESATRMDGNALHYTRTYTVRQLELPADRYPDLEKLSQAIETDEQSHAVFKKK
jgi:hypothetical protein